MKLFKRKKIKKTENIPVSQPKSQNIITNDAILSVLKIRGEYADYESGFSDEDIYSALYRAKRVLGKLNAYLHDDMFNINNEDLCCDADGVSQTNSKYLRKYLPSSRQMYCANSAIELSLEGKYNHALHEFMDAIDDYGHGRVRPVTRTEFALYMCVLTCFMKTLEKNSENPDLLKETAQKNIEREYHG